MVSGTLLFGENYVFPQITLSLATQTTEIYVSPSREEIAQDQFNDLEKQRVLGIVPNFYVTYESKAAAFATGGVSNLYIPQRDRHGARLTFENAAVALGTTAASMFFRNSSCAKSRQKREWSTDF
jgi:hypothetical protein